VYQSGLQATRDGDQLLVQILRGNTTVLTSSLITPGAWTGNMVFSSGGFLYTGDGTGDISVKIGPPVDNSVFDGAIDNLTISTTSSVPGPGTVALLGLGLVGIGAARRKQA